jgi:hypothetical protein
MFLDPFFRPDDVARKSACRAYRLKERANPAPGRENDGKDLEPCNISSTMVAAGACSACVWRVKRWEQTVPDTDSPGVCPKIVLSNEGAAASPE